MKEVEVFDENEDSFGEEINAKALQLDSFVVDIETLCNGTTANSRLTLQRSLSRKGSQRNERMITSKRDTGGDIRDGAPKAGSMTDSTPLEKSIMGNMVGEEVTDPFIVIQTQPIITTNIETKCKRYNKQRSSWVDPWRILLFFATLTSMGTIILIYFTLSIWKLDADVS
ncbi:hypothetical protein GIB67_021137 [Kingdonia uniflora]|uniref:Uncharacterized protein n=1 Tax=Kingdonia uniflora TaxID=39325 RepID=A0A7J7N7V8_9MAGN|nr:hypothetical protein GIB67_021137 [Kingdonia uniflora]